MYLSQNLLLVHFCYKKRQVIPGMRHRIAERTSTKVVESLRVWREYVAVDIRVKEREHSSPTESLY